MLKKSITYKNPFTDQEVTEEHFFHISKSDLIEMEMEEHSETYVKDDKTLTGMQAKLQRIVDSEDGKAIMAEFKDIIRRSYGKKDGDRFLKSSAIWEDFASTEAFSQLLFELCTNAEAASDFMNGIVPGNLEQVAEEVRQQAAKQATKINAASPSEAKPTMPFESSDEPTIERPAVATMTPERQELINNSTPESPVTLTKEDLADMSIHHVKIGLGSGRFEL